jgi:hypothetical protein
MVIFNAAVTTVVTIICSFMFILIYMYLIN